ncbi:MAG: hypothetical protein ACLFU8_11020 [Anaerolineales bacterium]
MFLRSAAAVAAALTLALAYCLGGVWMGAGITGVLGLLWLLEQQKVTRPGRVWGSLLLLLYVGAAALGFWLELEGPLLLAGVVVALAAWDLESFVRRVRALPHLPVHETLARQHLGRLLFVSTAGLILGLVALLAPIQLSFGLALVFGLLLFLALAQVIAFLRRSGG